MAKLTNSSILTKQAQAQAQAHPVPINTAVPTNGISAETDISQALNLLGEQVNIAGDLSCANLARFVTVLRTVPACDSAEPFATIGNPNTTLSTALLAMAESLYRANLRLNELHERCELPRS